MIIGIDLHGVIDSNVEAFKKFLAVSIDLEITIYIISGPPENNILAELNKYGIEKKYHFDKIFSIVDYLKEKNIKMWIDKKGRWWADDKDWWGSKAEICDSYNVDIMIDDKERYKAYFKNKKTKFILYNEGVNCEDMQKLRNNV